MDDLVQIPQFLRARLDEDEQTARAAAPGPWNRMGQRVLDASPPSDRLGIGMAVGHAAASADYNETAIHIARHDPVRVLAEVDAKRRLLDDILGQTHERNEEDNWYSCCAARNEDGELVCTDESRAGDPCDCGRDRTVERRVRLFALPYADHPDYRDEWRPSS